MKILRRLIAFLAIAAYSLLAPKAWGQVGSFAMGSSNIVENYCVTNSKIMGVWLFQQTTNGLVAAGNGFVSQSFTNEEDLQAVFHGLLSNVVQGTLLTNNAVDKSRPILINSRVVKHDPVWDHRYFECYQTFSLVKTNGEYVLPDLSGILLKISDPVEYEVPGLQWARIEVYYSGDSYAFEVDDPRYDPDYSQTGIVPELQRIFVDYAAVTSGTNGGFRLKFMIVSGTNDIYQVFDGTGRQVPETPLVITGIKASSGAVPGSLTGGVVGGDPGRLFVVQSAPGLQGPWVGNSQTNEVPDYGQTIPVPLPGDGSSLFYRLMAVNGMPY